MELQKEAKHFAYFFTKRMLTYCEEVSETLRLLLYNKNGVAKGSETLRLLFHKKKAKKYAKHFAYFYTIRMELQKEAKHFAYFFTRRIITYCEGVSKTLGLLLYNKDGVAKGRETLRLVFHNKNAIRMQKFA